MSENWIHLTAVDCQAEEIMRRMSASGRNDCLSASGQMTVHPKSEMIVYQLAEEMTVYIR